MQSTYCLLLFDYCSAHTVTTTTKHTWRHEDVEQAVFVFLVSWILLETLAYPISCETLNKNNFFIFAFPIFSALNPSINRPQKYFREWIRQKPFLSIVNLSHQLWMQVRQRHSILLCDVLGWQTRAQQQVLVELEVKASKELSLVE